MINVVQLGANEGKTYSDIVWRLIRNYEWKGLFVEPLPESFEKLKQYYSDVEGNYFERCAIMPLSDPKSITLYYNLERTASASTKPNWHCNNTSTTVPTMTLVQLLEKYGLVGVEFDLLQIDIEGVDAEVLLASDFTNILPKYIRLETHHIGSSQKKKVGLYLKKWGYIETHPDPFWAEYAHAPTFEVDFPGIEPEGMRYNTVYEKMD